MTTHFTSDTHLFHNNIIKYCERPFADLDDMHLGLMRRWNAVVRPEDFVWILGDFDMNGKDKALELLPAFNGTKALVTGNHDACWPGQHTKVQKLIKARDKYIDAGFALVVEHAQIKIAGETVMLSHFPYEGDSHDGDRYEPFRLRDEGRWLLHGHTHNAEQKLHDGKQIHVGVDAWEYTPVSENEIAELMGEL